MSPKYFTPQLSRRAKSQGPGLFPVDKLKGVSVFEISIQELQSHFSDGYFTSVDYVGLCLKRIREVDEYIEAVIEVNPDAMAIAQDLDKERDAGVVRGPLHGVPVLVKDNIATKDAMQTTAGSWALLGSVVPKDAFVVSKLRRAGAVIIGHANMSEWASLRSKTYSTGYSPRGGQVRNPFDLTKSPFGSSSGSAAAVSANFVPVAFGSETDTSIIGPASINGVVGIKPTVGLTSRAGVIPISRHMDSVGPIARTVADAVFALDATVGEDPDDLATASPGRCGEDLRYSQFLSSAEALRGARFGLPMKRCWDLVPPSCKAVATNVLEAMKRAGAEIVEVELPSVEERVNESGTWDWEHGDPAHSEWTVAKIDAYNGINSYLQNLAESPVRSLEEIIEYNVQNVGTEGGLPGVVPAFDGQPNFEEMAQSKGVEDETYKSALSHIRRQTRENGLDSALMYGNSVLDALIFCDRRGIGQQYAAQAGYPIICIPIGLDNHGMPISLSFQHTAWGESKLVKWASAVEDLWNKENGWRAIPTFHNVHAKNMPIEKVVND